MPEKLLPLITTLKGLGVTQRNQIKLYGKIFQITSEPLVATGVVAFRESNRKKVGAVEICKTPFAAL